MPAALPSIRQLTYLLSLHEHRHFGRAAAACAVTQSTLSVGIAELERLLGAALVERSRRQLHFTPIGEEVAGRAAGIVRAAEDLAAAAQGSRAPLTGPMRLAAIPTIAPFALPRLLIAAAADWPGLRLSVREMLTGAACEALARGQVDCVLLAMPADCVDAEMVGIATDRLLLATLPGGTARDVVAPDDIDAARLLLLEDGHCLKDHALALCASADRPREARVVASTLHTLVRLVDADLGVTLVPELAVSAGLLDGTRVEGHRVEGPGAEREIALAWRRGHPLRRDFAMLADTFRRAINPPG